MDVDELEGDRYTCKYEADMQTSIYVGYLNKIEPLKNKN